MLRDLDELLLPAVTHWQSPRFFAYFANTGSEPGILAELLVAGLNQVGILWRTSPALQELEEVTLDWLAQLLGLPDGLHGHLEDTASTGTIVALAAARQAKPGARVVVCSEHAHSSVEKACRLLELEARATPADDAFRLRMDALDLTDACAVVATLGTTSTSSLDPVDASRTRARRGALAARRRRLRGLGGGLPRVARCTSPAGNGPTRSSSTRTSGCSRRWAAPSFWTRRPDDVRAAFSLVPEFLRVSEDVASFSEYSPALGRQFRALKLWAVLRCYGREGLQERIREAIRLAALFEAWVRDEPGWELTAPRPFSLVCFRRDGSDEENEALLERVNATGEIFISHTKLNGRYSLRLAIGNARTTEDDVRSRLGRAQARSGSASRRRTRRSAARAPRRRPRSRTPSAGGRRRGSRSRSRPLSTSTS